MFIKVGMICWKWNSIGIWDYKKIKDKYGFFRVCFYSFCVMSVYVIGRSRK